MKKAEMCTLLLFLHVHEQFPLLKPRYSLTLYFVLDNDVQRPCKHFPCSSEYALWF